MLINASWHDVQHEAFCGICHIEPEDCLANDCLCENLYGGYDEAYSNRKSRNDYRLYSMPVVLSCESSLGHMELQRAHPPTSDLNLQEDHIFCATLGRERSLDLFDEQSLSSLNSKHCGFSLRLQEYYLRLDNSSVFPCELCLFLFWFPLFSRRLDESGGIFCCILATFSATLNLCPTIYA